MSVWEWVVWGITETVKILLLSYGVFGFEWRKSRSCLPACLCFLAGFFCAILANFDETIFTLLWNLGLVCVFFEGKRSKKIQAALLMCVAITAIDTMIWGFLLLPGTWTETQMDMASEGIGVLFWIAAAWWMKRYRAAVQAGFSELSVPYYCLLLFVLSGVGFHSANTLAAVQGLMTGEMAKVSYVISNIVLVILLAGAAAFVRLIYSRQKFQFERDSNQRRFEAQNEYYEMVQKKSDELRHFRHDVKKHISALLILCQENRIENISEYLQELQGTIRETALTYTGHPIVDYFVNDMMEAFREDDEVTFAWNGRFSKRMKLSDPEVCVLFGNAIENSREALERGTGSRRFACSVKTYQDMTFIRMANTAGADDGTIRMTEKRDKENHGYGMENMRRIVKKHGGTIEWKREGEWFVLEIQI